MDPKAYLDARGESEQAFAIRARIHQRSLNRALISGNCTLRLARDIVNASRKEPAPGGETITYEDLAARLGPETTRDVVRKRKRRKARSRANGNGSRIEASAA
jgi:hypothetical protein